MPEPTQSESAQTHMDIARVARLLWNKAGRPAGRFVEYWAKAQRAVYIARDLDSFELMAVGQVQNSVQPVLRIPAIMGQPPAETRSK